MPLAAQPSPIPRPNFNASFGKNFLKTQETKGKLSTAYRTTHHGETTEIQ